MATIRQARLTGGGHDKYQGARVGRCAAMRLAPHSLSVMRRAGSPFQAMSDRIDKSWVVLESIESPHRDYCVDLFARPDGTFGFEQFRRDPEDLGRWTGISYFSDLTFSTKEEAMDAAKRCADWLRHADASRE